MKALVINSNNEVVNFIELENDADFELPDHKILICNNTDDEKYIGLEYPFLPDTMEQEKEILEIDAEGIELKVKKKTKLKEWKKPKKKDD